MNSNQIISQSQQEEKAKYITVIRKITSLISIFDKLYGKSYHKKLLQTDLNLLKLTSFSTLILDSVKINHPLVKLLNEYVKKLDTIGDSSKFFLLLVKYLLEESFKIVEKGIKPTILAEMYREIASEVEQEIKDLVFEFDCVFKNYDKNISENLKDLSIAENINDKFNNEQNLSNIKEVDTKNEDSLDFKENIINVEEKNNNIEDNILKKTISINELLNSLLDNKFIINILSNVLKDVKSINSEKIRICKIPTGSIEDSYVVEGMVFEKEPEGEIKNIENGTTSIYNCSLDISRSELKSTVQMKTAEELYNFSKDESDSIQNKVDQFKSDVIICSGKVGELLLDFLNEKKILIFKILSKHDLRRIRECLGGSICNTLDEDIKFGKARKIKVFREGNKNYTKFLGNEVSTIILKNSLEVVLDEYEREILKCLRVLSKNIINNKIKVVDGAGKFEKTLSMIYKNKNPSDINLKFVYESISKAFDKFSLMKGEAYDIINPKMRAIKYALDFVSILYETDDYLIGIQEKLNIKPRMNEDWDVDH